MLGNALRLAGSGAAVVLVTACAGTVAPRLTETPWAYDVVQSGTWAGTLPGPEDVATDGRGTVWISATGRWRQDSGAGRLYRLRLTDTEPAPKDVTPPESVTGPFRPLGIDYFEQGKIRRLFVVDYRSQDAGTREQPKCGTSRVLIFDVGKDGTLSLFRKIEPLEAGDLPDPNDIQATGPDSFYVTNLYGNRSCDMAAQYVSGDLGYVTHYAPKTRFAKATPDLPMPNGIAMDPTGRYLYVSSARDGILHAFARKADGSLDADPRRIAVGGALDNIHVLGDGSLLVASHPYIVRFLLEAKLGVPAPSHLVRVYPDDGRAEKVFDNGGWLTSAASSAVAGTDAAGRTMVVLGDVYRDGPTILRLRTPLPVSVRK